MVAFVGDVGVEDDEAVFFKAFFDEPLGEFFAHGVAFGGVAGGGLAAQDRWLAPCGCHFDAEAEDELFAAERRGGVGRALHDGSSVPEARRPPQAVTRGRCTALSRAGPEPTLGGCLGLPSRSRVEV